MAFGWDDLILGGLGALTGALGQTKGARTQETNSTQTQSQTSSGKTSTRRTVLPEQEGLLGPMAQQILQRIQNPEATINPLRSAASSRINSKYAAAPQALRDKYLTGGGRSGKYGAAARETEFARLGELGSSDSEFDKLILQMQDSGLTGAYNLLGMNFGQEGETSTTSDGKTTFQGTNVQPGSALAGGIGGGVETIMTLLSLNKLLEGSGGKPISLFGK